MAHYNGTTSTPPKLAVTLPPTIEHYNGTLQLHHVHSPKVGRHPSPPPTPCNSTQQWHPAMAPRPLPQSWPSHSPPPTPCNSTQQWHPAMAPRPLHPAMAPWCHVQSAKVVRRPPPLLEVRTPIAIAIGGKMASVVRPHHQCEVPNVAYLGTSLVALQPLETSVCLVTVIRTFADALSERTWQSWATNSSRN